MPRHTDTLAPIKRTRVSSYSRTPSQIEQIFYGDMVLRLKHAREDMDMTQAQLDERLNVADGQVAKWESFERLPGAFMMVCWALALDVRILAVGFVPEKG